MTKFLKKLMKFAVILAILAVAAIMAAGWFGYKQAIAHTPLSQRVEEVRDDADYVPLNEIQKDFTDSIVAIEDRRFYEHGPIDIIALVRAAIVNIREGEPVQGGSTLTQQVAKNLYFSQDKTFLRKAAEIFVARDLEEQYTKDEILELYVNVIYYGDGNYGIGEASNDYFHKTPAELTFDEATLLAGLPQAPSAYALSTNYDRAKIRQTAVIEALEEYRQ